MKRKSLSELILICVCGGLSLCASAQQTTALPTSDKLAEAIDLINSGNPAQAKDLIASITPDDPGFVPAQFYKALALDKMTNTIGFLKVMESLPTNAVAVPLDVKEYLDFKKVGAQLEYRKFDEMLPETRAFPQWYPASSRLAAVSEYRMAGLFEWGLKNVYDTRNLKDAGKINSRRNEAVTNLTEFLSLASSFQGTNYHFLPKRTLKQDVWLARIILGDGDAALTEIPARDAAAREEFSFLRVQLLVERLQRNHVDENLVLILDFLKQFPESSHRKRIEFDLYDCSFHEGKRLCEEADAAEKSGDTKTAAEKRALAHRYFDYVRSLQNQITPDKASRIEVSDVLEYQDDLLETYYLEKDIGGLQAATDSLLAKSTPGSVGWMMGKLYESVVLLTQPEPDTTAAVTALDGILAQGFKNKPDHDHWVISAAKWRIYAATHLGDTQKGPELVKWIRNANCTKNIKDAFLKTYGSIN